MPRKRFTLKSAVHIFLIREQHILLLKRFNTGYEDGNYSVIAGHLDGGEEVKTAAIREAREEAGIHLLHRDLAIVGVMHRKATDERIDFFATAATWSGDIINAEPHKCSELAWFALNHLPENTIPYIRRLSKTTKVASGSIASVGASSGLAVYSSCHCLHFQSRIIAHHCLMC